MLAAVAPVTALLVSVAFLLMGNGLQGTLLPVRASLEGFAAPEIGLIGTAYYLGFGAGCYFGGRLVRRAGHIRAFSAMASLASAIALIHALFLNPAFWWLFRGTAGFCFAVLYVVIESWLNETASNENRGFVLSVYNIINLTVITIGQMMMVLYDPAAFPLFALASVLISLAVMPLSMTRSPAPAPVETVRLRLRHLYRISPVACAGVAAVGLANGAFWAMAPVFAQGRGLDVTGIALFMSATVLAGAAAQWPLGWLSDHRDRRHVILGACLLGAAAGIAMVLFEAPWAWLDFALVAVFGAMAFPLYAVCVAHMNDYVARDEFVEASSVLLLLYAAGASVGAIPASVLMGEIGPGGLFAFTATAHLGLAAFAVLRMRRRAAPPAAEKDQFVSVPRTSPTVFALDPRGPLADERATTEDEVSIRDVGFTEVDARD